MKPRPVNNRAYPNLGCQVQGEFGQGNITRHSFFRHKRILVHVSCTPKISRYTILLDRQASPAQIALCAPSPTPRGRRQTDA